MNSGVRELRPWIVIIAVILMVGVLRVGRVVLMPVAVSLFVVVLAWPLQRRLEQRLPHALSVAVTFLIISLVVLAFGVALWLCANSIAGKTDFYQQRLEALYSHLEARAGARRFSHLLHEVDPNQIFGRMVGILGGLAAETYQLLGFVVLVAAFVALVLFEVTPFQRCLEQHLQRKTLAQLKDAAQNTVVQVQRFILTRSMTSITTGLLTGLFAWAVGLDFALVWAFLSFVLNYIPVLGAIAAVIPPTLVAMLQWESLGVPLTTLGVLSAIHFVVGNYADPLLQGHFLSLSPVVVFYSLVFWSWLWGIPGALLAVPLTVGLVIFCRHFENTRWLAELVVRT